MLKAITQPTFLNQSRNSWSSLYFCAWAKIVFSSAGNTASNSLSVVFWAMMAGQLGQRCASRDSEEAVEGIWRWDEDGCGGGQGGQLPLDKIS